MAHFFGFTSNKTVTERFPLFDSGFNPEWTPPVMTGGVQLHLLYSGNSGTKKIVMLYESEKAE